MIDPVIPPPGEVIRVDGVTKAYQATAYPRWRTSA